MRVFFLLMSEYYSEHAKTLGTAFSRGTQADVRGATQLLDRGAQADARGSCLSQGLDRFAQAVARGAVPRASQVLDRGAEPVARGTARCASHVLGRGTQAGAKAVLCGDATLPHQEKNTRQMSTSGEHTQSRCSGWCFDLFLRRRGAVASREEHSADARCASHVLDRGVQAGA
jgi:hypothetical protein